MTNYYNLNKILITYFLTLPILLSGCQITINDNPLGDNNIKWKTIFGTLNLSDNKQLETLIVDVDYADINVIKSQDSKIRYKLLVRSADNLIWNSQILNF